MQNTLICDAFCDFSYLQLLDMLSWNDYNYSRHIIIIMNTTVYCVAEFNVYNNKQCNVNHLINQMNYVKCCLCSVEFIMVIMC